MKELQTGLTATVSETVLYTNTASALGSGLLDVYATPAMVALMEKAAVKTIQPFQRYLTGQSCQCNCRADCN